MPKSKHAGIRLLIQFIMAILQSVAAIAFFAYLLIVEPNFGPGTDAILIFLISFILFVFVHAAYRVIDGALVWSAARNTGNE